MMSARQVHNDRLGLQEGGDALVKHKYKRGLDDGNEANMPKLREANVELVGQSGEGQVPPPHWS